MELSLDELIRSVESAAEGPLEQLEVAWDRARQLGELGDAALNHFVDRSRRAGHSWAEIGEHLGVTRQAVQRRFGPGDEAPRPEAPQPPRVRQEHHGKYKPLWTWLNGQRSGRVDTTFKEIETLLGFPLPPSSRKHQPHWHSYAGSAVVRAIVDAGWRAQGVDLARETVTFVRHGRPSLVPSTSRTA